MAVRAVRGAVQVGGNERGEILAGTAELVTEVMSRNELQHRRRDQRDLYRDARPDRGVPGPGRPQARLPGGAAAVRVRDRRARRDAACGPADDAHRDDQAAVGACSTSTCAAPRRCGWTSRNDGSPPSSVGRHRDRSDRHVGGAGAARARRARSGWPTATPRPSGWPRTSARARRCPADGVPGGPADVAVLAVPPAAVAAELRAAQAPRPGPLLHRRGQREGTAAGRRPRAWLRPGQLRARPSAVRPRAVRPRRGQGRPVRGPALGALPAAGQRRRPLSLVTGLAQACGAQPVAPDSG